MGHFIKQQTKKKLDQYLFKNKLNELCYFSDNQIVGFHWANDKVAANYFREMYENKSIQFNERVDALKSELEMLKYSNIWLMSKRGQLKSTIYNLYECYLDPRLKYQWFELEDILVSTQHEAGPFCSIKSMRWFDKEIFSKFIYLKMLQDCVPQRSFRLNLNIPLEMRADGSPFGTINGKISQMTERGLLIHLSNGNPLKEWSHREVSFLKKPLALGTEHTDDIFCSSAWIHALGNFSMRGDLLAQKLENGLKRQGVHDHFVFIPFEEMNMLSVKGHDKSIDDLKSLFAEAEESIHNYIRNVA